MKVMIDQKSRISRFEDTHDIGEIITKLGIIGLVFTLIISAWAIYNTMPEPPRVEDYKIGLMVSPDYESYMHKYRDGMVFNEMDAE